MAAVQSGNYHNNARKQLRCNALQSSALQNMQTGTIARTTKATPSRPSAVSIVTPPSKKVAPAPAPVPVSPALLNLPDKALASAVENFTLAELVSIVAPPSRETMMDCTEMRDTSRLARLIELTEAGIVARLWSMAAARNTSGKVDSDVIKMVLVVMGRFAAKTATHVASAATNSSGD